MPQPAQTTPATAHPTRLAPAHDGPATMTVEHLTFGYRRNAPVLSDITASLHPGRLTALIGPNATGKTTLLRLMLGQQTPWQGRVLLDGKPIDQHSAQTRARRLSYVAQQSPVAFSFSVRQVVAMGRFAQSERGSLLAIERALSECDLLSIADRPFNELSGGQQQRVSVARAMAQSGWGEPGGGRAILLDEPVASADLQHAHQTLGLLKRAADDNRAVLVVLHDLNLAARWADEVWLMEGGALAYAGPWDKALTAQRLGAIYGATLTALTVPGDPRPVFHVAVPPHDAPIG